MSEGAHPTDRDPAVRAVGATDGRRDLMTILAIQALRAFLYGFGSVLIGSELAQAGYTDAQVGLILTAMLAGFALASITVGTIGDRAGRRRVYGGLLLLMGAAGTVFALTEWLPALLVAALSGTVSVEANESGPITSLEQAMIPTTSEGLAWRNRAFGRYNAIAYLFGSFGALAAGGPDFFRRFFPALPASQRFLLVYPVIGIVGGLLVLRLSPRVEAGRNPQGPRRPPLVRSRKTVSRLAALFALDAFAGGFVVNAFIVYWFETRFGASIEVMGLVFFLTGLLQAGSSIAAGWLANRIGQLNTMVFTHLPSNVLLMLVPLMPNLELAVGMWLARSVISQMDVPARQAYVVSVVDPEERTAAASYTNTARYVVRPGGAAIGGWLTGIWIAGPFVVAGGLKIVYDLIIWRSFRRVRAREESAD